VPDVSAIRILLSIASGGAKLNLRLPGGTHTLGGQEVAILRPVELQLMCVEACTLDAEGASRHFRVEAGATVTLHAMVLTNGASSGLGGALLALQGTIVHLNDVIVAACYAAYGGGGVAFNGSAATLSDGEFVSCTTGGPGGAMLAVAGAAVSANGTKIEECFAATNGGAACCLGDNTHLALSSSKIKACAANTGGGISVFDHARLVAEDTDVIDCTTGAKTSYPAMPEGFPPAELASRHPARQPLIGIPLGFMGGGYDIAYFGVANITGGKVAGCISFQYAGAISVIEQASAYISAVECDGNYAGMFVGAIFAAFSASFTMVSSRITNSYVDGLLFGGQGGGFVVMFAGYGSIEHSYVANCTAAIDGGLMWVHNGGLAMIKNSIFETCTAPSEGGFRLTAGSKLDMQDCKMHRCSATSAQGGAIGLEGDSLLQVWGSLFSQNVAATNGGTINLVAGHIDMQNTSITGSDARIGGGAWHMSGGSGIISSDCHIEQCTADELGGGFCIVGGELHLYGWVVLCESRGAGGAIGVEGGKVVVRGRISNCVANIGGACTVSGGVVDVDAIIEHCDATDGGGINVNKGEVIVNGQVLQCKASSDGGAFRLAAPAGSDIHLRITASVIGCTATNGGVAYLTSGNLQMHNAVFTDNTCTKDGGCVKITGGTMSIINCMFIRCIASEQASSSLSMGGAIDVVGGDSSMFRTIFSECVAHTGGGISVRPGSRSVTLLSTNFSRCRAWERGSAIFIAGDMKLDDPYVRGSIVDVSVSCSSDFAGNGEPILPFQLRASSTGEHSLRLSKLRIHKEPTCGEELLTSANLLSAFLDANAVGEGAAAQYIISSCGTDTCGDRARCVDKPVNGTSISSPVCSCPLHLMPAEDVTGGPDLAPYISGCIEPRVAQRVQRAAASAEAVVQRLLKTTTAAVQGTARLELIMGGQSTAQAFWRLIGSLPSWLDLDAANGTIDTDEGAADRPVTIATATLDTTGLPEQPEPYEMSLGVVVESAADKLLTVPVFLFVRALDVSAHWGQLQPQAKCNPRQVGEPSTLRLGVLTTLAFTACDVEELAVSHSLPSVDDSRSFRARLHEITGNSFIDCPLTYTSRGAYDVQVKPTRLGNHELELTLGEKGERAQVALPQRVRVRCPEGLVRTEESQCGCPAGFEPAVNSPIASGAFSCVPCKFGHYKEAASNVACVACPVDSSTDALGATNASQCRCNPSYYKEADGVCEPCPVGANCNRVGITLENLPLEKGYYRISVLTANVRECPDKNSGHTGCEGNVDTGGVGSVCAETLDGIYCTSCSDIFSGADVFYSLTDSECRECGSTSWWSVFLVGVAFIVFLVVRDILYGMAGSRSASRGLRIKRRVIARLLELPKRVVIELSLLAKGKICVGFYQVCTQVKDVYQVSFPNDVMSALSALSFFSLNFENLGFKFDCLGMRSYDLLLLFYLTTPIVLLLCTPIIGFFSVLMQTRSHKPDESDGLFLLTSQRSPASLHEWCERIAYAALPNALLISYLAYPIVSSAAFRTFACEDFGNQYGSYLAADYEMHCDSRTYARTRAIAWIAIIIYAIGIPCSYAVLLYHARKALLLDKPTELSRALGFICREYRPSVFWWEVVELSRKLLLVGFATLINRGSLDQLCYGLLVCVCYMLLIAKSEPFKHEADNIAADAAALAQLAFFFWCVVLRTTQDHVNISLLLMLSIFAIFFVVLVLMAIKGLTLRVQHLHKSSEEKLWAASTINPPTTHWRTANTYACFVSHVKAEAGSDARFLHDLLRKALRCAVFLDSDTLTDLRNLFDEGVYESDVLLVLFTPHILTRPWCLLEMYAAAKADVPVLFLHLTTKPYHMENAVAFVRNLEKSLSTSGIDALSAAAPDLQVDELKSTLLKLLPDPSGYEPVTFNSNASDNNLIADMQHAVEHMAKLAHIQVHWEGTDANAEHFGVLDTALVKAWSWASGLGRRLSSRSLEDDLEGLEFSRSSAPMGKPLAYICHLHTEAGSAARNLQLNLIRGSWKPVLISQSGVDSDSLAAASSRVSKCSSCIVLLTQSVLSNAICLLELQAALSAGLSLVPVYLEGCGYDYAAARDFLADLEGQLAVLKPEEHAKLLRHLPNSTPNLGGKNSGSSSSLSTSLSSTFDPEAERQAQIASMKAFGAELNATLPVIIATSWNPDGSEYHMSSATKDIFKRLRFDWGASRSMRHASSKPLLETSTKMASFSVDANKGIVAAAEV